MILAPVEMSREEYALSFVRNALGFPLNFKIDLSDAQVNEIVQYLSGKWLPDEYLAAPVNGTLKDTLANSLRRQLQNGRPILRKATWPDGLEFAVALTHDVDRLTAPLGHVLRVRERFSAATLLRRSLLLDDPYWNIEKMVRLESDLGFSSSFYLLIHDYDLGEKKKYILSTAAQGWDVELHGSFGTHDDIGRMKEDVQIFTKELGNRPVGIREHYLRFDPLRTWELMEEAGFVYDTTWGFNEKPGFKAGVSLPYHPPSPSFETMKILEIPLVLMDTSLWGYMHLEEDEGFGEVEKVLSKVKSEKGLFTLLWHQEALQMRGGRLYARILKRLSQEKCFISNALQIARWWLNRENSTIREESNRKNVSYYVQSNDSRLVLEAEFPKSSKFRLDGECRILASNETRAIIGANGICKVTVECA